MMRTIPTLWLLCLTALIACSSDSDSDDPGFRMREDGQKEFLQPVPLLDESGDLIGRGWGRGAMMEYDRELTRPAQPERLKEWEHYTVMTPDYTVAITLSDIGLAVFANVTVEDYRADETHSAIFLDAGDGGSVQFPDDPYGVVLFEGGGNRLELQYIEGGTRRIEFSFGEEGEENHLGGLIECVEAPGWESIAAARPFSAPGEFFYENKIFGMPSTGWVKAGQQEYRLPEGESFAILDWGRGVWAESSEWEWGQAAGKVGDRVVGFNIGQVFADDSMGNMDSILVDGKIHKLGRVEWSYDQNDWTAPWRFQDAEGRFDMTLEPFYEEIMDLQLGFYSGDLHKLHGLYSGTIRLDDGETIRIEGMLGFAEHMLLEW